MDLSFGSFVLAAATGDLGDEPAAREHADAVEFRMDLAGAPLAALSAYDGELPLIVTNRAAWEGGEADPEGRLGSLERALDAGGVAAVDLELGALRGEGASDPDRARDLLSRARDRGVATVVSVHDFEGTPPAEECRELLAAACEAGDVGKLAVTAEDRGDALALLGATHRATAAGRRVATMAMGEAGRHTRAVAPVYGSRVGYAPVDPAEATAPGQYDLATLADLVGRLGARSTDGN